jgi:hypothetical protein
MTLPPAERNRDDEMTHSLRRVINGELLLGAPKRALANDEMSPGFRTRYGRLESLIDPPACRQRGHTR